MLIAFWLLLFLYIGLTLLYAVTKLEGPKITPWPLLPTVPKKEALKPTCQSSADCPGTHVCLSHQCIPKLIQTARCNPDTGHWISYIFQGATFAICVCLQPDLVNQKYFGGNCDVDQGCGIHGRYIQKQNICECDPGYKPVGLICQKLPVVDTINKRKCWRNELYVKNITPQDGFHKDYINSLGSLKCVKKPCTFDAINGRPLKRGKFEPDWGCICDPRYGLYGIVLEGTDKKYLTTPGFDACGSIFRKDPPNPIPISFITYFYLNQREPLSLVIYWNLKDEDLISPLKGRNSPHLIMGQQPWKFDYAQYYFKTTPKIRARTRCIYMYKALYIKWERVNEWLYNPYYKIPLCSHIPKVWENNTNPRVDAYDLLYKYPVCISEDSNNTMFYNKVIVNPQQLTFRGYPVLHRFNSFHLYYDANPGVNRWTLDLEHEYNINAYVSIQTNAPYYKVEINNMTVPAYP